MRGNCAFLSRNRETFRKMNLANVLGLRTGAIVVCAFAMLPLACGRNVQWSGCAHRRILVKISPRDLKGRPLARMPARLKIEAQIDPASLEVVRYDPDAGRPYPVQPIHSKRKGTK
jgi:hypothetical protein